LKTQPKPRFGVKLLTMELKQFPGISAEAFVADTDRKALDALKRIPLLPKVVHKFYESGLDRWLYCWNMAMSVRCGPKQYPTLHKVLQECCKTLDMPEPELFITSNPFPNAFAGGVERPYITLHSSVVGNLTDDQLYHLMGHELGHIKCDHVLYMSVARVLLPLLELIGRRTLGLGDVAQIALALAFLEWSRQAELSADRAGLLCTQDFHLSAGANLALCAGPSRLADESSIEAFLDQSRSYQDMTGLDAIGKALVFVFYGSMSTHPMPVYRTQALERWAVDGDYERILKGEYKRSEK